MCSGSYSYIAASDYCMHVMSMEVMSDLVTVNESTSILRSSTVVSLEDKCIRP